MTHDHYRHKKNALGAFFLLLLATSYWLISYADILIAKVLFSILQGLLLVGVLEAVHQSTHQNFFTARWANKYVGMALGLGILIHFARYRFFHAHHHAYTATQLDPERSLYLGATKNGALSFVLAPYSYLLFAYIVFASRFVAYSHKKDERLNTILFVSFLAAMLVGSFWYPTLFLFHYWLPLFVFSWLDFLFNQAEHYGSKEISGDSDPIHVTNDLLLPRFISFLILFRTFHRVHHISPKTPWFLMPAEYKAIGLPGMPFKYFLRKYFQEGPRQWGIR